MKRKHDWMPVWAGLFVSVGIAAQPAAAGVKSAQDIACELAGNCPIPAEAAQPLPDPDAADEAPTRGWTFGSKPKPKETKQAEPVVVRPAQRVLPPRPRAIDVSTLDVQFARGSATLSDEALSQVDELADALRRPSLAGHKYRIVGHTVAVGNPALNKDLSVRRAKAVADYLASKGFSPTQFEVDGQGDTQPLKGVAVIDPSNRRVEVERID